MALSNTAVPKYYGQFRDQVLRHEIPVNREVGLEMNRIDELIANPLFYYDDKAIDGFINFCEAELTLTDGSDLQLLDTFKLWSEQIFGWYYFTEREVWQPGKNGRPGRFVTKVVKQRLVKKQYLIVARGAAKSMYASCLHNYFLTVDTETTHQIATAPTMAQAEEVMSPIRTSITRARGPYFQFLTDGSLQNTTGSRFNRQKLFSSKKGVENNLTNSLLEVRPMTKDKLQGLRSKINTIDEWLSGDVREDVIGALEQGASKLEDYLIVAISSEGTVRNGSGDSIKMELQKILNGDYYDPHTSIWHYKLDDIKEVNDPSMWLKAQPNLNRTVTYETYHRDVERAAQAPAARNDILAKRFGIPMEGFTYFFSYAETEVFSAQRPRAYDGMVGAMGADLSQGDDFCAFTFLFPLPDGRFGVQVRSYISQKTLDNLPGATRLKYNEFLAEDTLHVLEGSVIDLDVVYEDIDAFITDHKYDIAAFGYDPYNANEFVKRWTTENGPFGVEKVIQGSKTESVPLGELKNFSQDRQLVFTEKLMSYAMGNAITLEDTNGNRKLSKLRHENKIDNVSALMDAYVAWKRNREAFE
jgi:phage terminase large subunit-like protein